MIGGQVLPVFPLRRVKIHARGSSDRTVFPLKHGHHYVESIEGRWCLRSVCTPPPSRLVRLSSDTYHWVERVRQLGRPRQTPLLVKYSIACIAYSLSRAGGLSSLKSVGAKARGLLACRYSGEQVLRRLPAGAAESSVSAHVQFAEAERPTRAGFDSARNGASMCRRRARRQMAAAQEIRLSQSPSRRRWWEIGPSVRRQRRQRVVRRRCPIEFDSSIKFASRQFSSDASGPVSPSGVQVYARLSLDGKLVQIDISYTSEGPAHARPFSVTLSSPIDRRHLPDSAGSGRARYPSAAGR